MAAAGAGQSRDLVSILLPIHNAAKYLDEAVDSILKQTYRPLQICAHDDGSADGSLDMIRAWEGRCQKAGVELTITSSATRRGAGWGRNRAAQSSRGAWLCFVDADDVLHPLRVELQVELARKNPDAIIGTSWRRFPAGSTPRYERWSNSVAGELLYLHCFREVTLAMPTWLLHRRLYERVGGFSYLRAWRRLAPVRRKLSVKELKRRRRAAKQARKAGASAGASGPQEAETHEVLGMARLVEVGADWLPTGAEPAACEAAFPLTGRSLDEHLGVTTAVDSEANDARVGELPPVRQLPDWLLQVLAQPVAAPDQQLYPPIVPSPAAAHATPAATDWPARYARAPDTSKPDRRCARMVLKALALFRQYGSNLAVTSALEAAASSAGCAAASAGKRPRQGATGGSDPAALLPLLDIHVPEDCVFFHAHLAAGGRLLRASIPEDRACEWHLPQGETALPGEVDWEGPSAARTASAAEEGGSPAGGVAVSFGELKYRRKPPLTYYRYYPDSASTNIPRRLLLRVKAAAVCERVIESWAADDSAGTQAAAAALAPTVEGAPAAAAEGSGSGEQKTPSTTRRPWYSIWGAGRDGSDLFKALPARLADGVRAFVDIDQARIRRGFETRDMATGQTWSLPVVPASAATPPLLVCVALDRFEGELTTRIAEKDWQHGRDFFYIS